MSSRMVTDWHELTVMPCNLQFPVLADLGPMDVHCADHLYVILHCLKETWLVDGHIFGLVHLLFGVAHLNMSLSRLVVFLAYLDPVGSNFANFSTDWISVKLPFYKIQDFWTWQLLNELILHETGHTDIDLAFIKCTVWANLAILLCNVCFIFCAFFCYFLVRP